MDKKKKNKIGTHRIIVIIVILIYILIGIILIPRIVKKIKVKAASHVVDEVIGDTISIKDKNGDSVDFEAIYNSLDADEKEQVDVLVDKYTGPETIQDIKDMAEDGISREEAYSYIEENVESEDIDYIMSLYDKYY